VPNFERLWKTAEIASSLSGVNYLRHHELGELWFDHSSFVPEGSAFFRVLMFIPRDAHTAATVTSLAHGPHETLPALPPSGVGHDQRPPRQPNRH
jgi:hypothetical protein